MQNKEIEYKYWATGLAVWEFENKLRKAAHSSYQGIHFPKYKYVVSCDDYWENLLASPTPGKAEFIRFRKGGGIHELTIKRKKQENVVRDEVNIDISGNSETSVSYFLTLLGCTKAFQVYKEAWIWFFYDCVVSYYTLPDGRSVVELEAIDYSTTQEGIDIINSYEKLLEIEDLEKEKRSLYEIFTDEKRDGKYINTVPQF